MDLTTSDLLLSSTLWSALPVRWERERVGNFNDGVSTTFLAAVELQALAILVLFQDKLMMRGDDH